MTVFKDKQFICFKFDDGKMVKYNLANGETIGKNNRVVKSLNTQLRGYTIQNIIDAIEDENYKNFMSFVNTEVNRSTKINYGWYGGYASNRMVNKITNVGSFLARVNDYAKYEQYFACGLSNVNLDSRSRDRITCQLKDIPKGLLKLCKEHNLRLDNDLLTSYNNIPNLYPVVLDMKFNSIEDFNIRNLLIYYGKHFDVREGGYCISDYIKIKFLVENYNYNIKSLLTYLDNLMTYEAIENFTHLCTEFYDYVKMASKLSNKFEKYPRYFLSTHRITCRNYERLKHIFEEQKFASRIDTAMEYKVGEYKFIYPQTTQDIKDEAVQQANCVASYIQRVIDGRCHIMFLRKQNKNKDKEEQYKESLITLEIVDYKVVQARGKFNRDLNADEKELVNKFNTYLEKLKTKREQKERVA